MKNEMIRWTWSDAVGPGRLMHELEEAGGTVVHAPWALKHLDNPEAIVDRLLGGRAAYRDLHTTVVEVHDKDEGYITNSSQAHFHTDGAEPYPPHLQILICVRPAKVGGQGAFVDTWPLLRKIERKDDAMFKELFELDRPMRFRMGITTTRRTFNWEGGTVVCWHPPLPTPGDPLGHTWHRMLYKELQYVYRATSGDISIINNHRVLHARTAFEGNEREMRRILVWLKKPLPVPESWANLAASGATGSKGGAAKGAAKPAARNGAAKGASHKGAVKAAAKGAAKGASHKSAAKPASHKGAAKRASRKGASASR
jgi:hypothetical protein